MIHLLPTPKSVKLTDERCKLDGLSLVVAPGQDRRVYQGALALQADLAKVLGHSVKLSTATPGACCVAIATKGDAGEGYRLSVTSAGITVEGDGPAGTFYGMQTLRQLLAGVTNSVLRGVEIADTPDFAVRGIYHDVTRGKVPTLDTLKRLVDTLSYYKINMLQLYIEDAFAFEEYEGIMQPFEVLTPAEIMELDEYCHARFVELTPSISTFGHLYRLLQSPKYRHLCEYENYEPSSHPWHEKMAHHTIDVFNPESITVIHSMIDQYVGLCRSEYFNICCDETFDLCKGRNAGKDVGEAYFGFVQQILERVRFHGKKPMMWGDIVLHHPEKIEELGEDVIMLNWDYGPCPTVNNTAAFTGAGRKQIQCPGTGSWNRWIEDAVGAKGNISTMARYGAEHGALGILTTNWGDYGNVCSINGALYGLTLGAQMGWQVNAPIDEEYEQAFSALAYGQQVNMVDSIRRLIACENTALWGGLVNCLGARDHADGDGKLHGCDSDRIREMLPACLQLQEELKALPQTEPTADLLLSARAVETMMRMYLYLMGEEEKPDVEPFLAAHREAWLRYNKQSQLTWVEYLFRSL